MTVQDISNQLITLFCEKDTFDVVNDLNKVNVDVGLNDKKTQITIAALKEMEKSGIVLQIGEGVWILKKPMGNYGQQIGLSFKTSMWIADTLNNFFKANDMEYELVDIFNINEGHLITLLEIIEDTLDDQTEEGKN